MMLNQTFKNKSNLAAKISLVSENDRIKAKKDGATEMVLWDKVVNYPSSDVGGIRDSLNLKALH